MSASKLLRPKAAIPLPANFGRLAGRRAAQRAVIRTVGQRRLWPSFQARRVREAQRQTVKSFLVLFFKKELLSS
jgi:hypothetical protein